MPKKELTSHIEGVISTNDHLLYLWEDVKKDKDLKKYIETNIYKNMEKALNSFQARFADFKVFRICLKKETD